MCDIVHAHCSRSVTCYVCKMCQCMCVCVWVNVVVIGNGDTWFGLKEAHVVAYFSFHHKKGELMARFESFGFCLKKCTRKMNKITIQLPQL